MFFAFHQNLFSSQSWENDFQKKKILLKKIELEQTDTKKGSYVIDIVVICYVKSNNIDDFNVW